MNFLFANIHELAALAELPHIQRVAYLMGIRPYMDRQTCIVGIKRKISYQSLREMLYVGPIAGVKTGSPSHQQMKRAVKSLERAGLVEIQSTERNLILKCTLATLDKVLQKQADPRPIPYPAINPTEANPEKSIDYEESYKNHDIVLTSEADPPQKLEVNYIYVYSKFEKFWESYPQKKAKQAAWEAFSELNPSEELFAKILNALNDQLAIYQQQQQFGQWVPSWKFAVNWLKQQCWEDEMNTEFQALNHDIQKQTATYKKQQPIDLFWEACKDGLNYGVSAEHTNE